MANSAGMLKESIWRDKDFRALPRSAQATYAQLLSQKELDRAGILPLQVSKWAKGCDSITEADLWVDLKLLEERRFIVVDEGTDEAFVRSYMRHSEVIKYPQYLKAAIRCAGMVGSEVIRHELAVELRRLKHKDATATAGQIDPGPTVPERLEHSAPTVPEPCPNGDGTVNPSGTLPAPSGVGEGVGVVTSVGGWAGEVPVERRAETGATRTTERRNEPPPRFCPKHMPDGTDDDCGACGGHRRFRDRWDAEHAGDAERAAQHDAHRREVSAQAAINACRLCDFQGHVNMPDLIGDGEHSTVCPHDADEIERARAEILTTRRELAQ